MKRRRWGRIVACPVLLACLWIPGAYSAFSIEGPRLVEDGRPFLVRGVVYSNVAIGAGWSDVAAGSACLYNRDFPLIAGLGANTIFTPALVPASDRFFARALRDNNLRWLAAFPLDRFYAPHRSLSPDTASGRALRAQILDEFKQYIESWVEEPRIIAFVFGLDVPAGYSGKFSGVVGDFYSLLRESAGVLEQASAGTRLLTTTVSDISQIGSLAAGAGDAGQPGLAFWSVEIHEAQRIDNVLEEVRTRTGKPALVSSFGVDAYDAGRQAEDAAAQGAAARSLALDLELAASGEGSRMLGGLWADFIDQWWRGGGDPATHGTSGVAAAGFPDGQLHAGWLGLFGTARTAIPGLDTLRARPAYFALAGVWGGVPAAELSWGERPAIDVHGFENAARGFSLLAPGGLVAIRGEAFSRVIRSVSPAELSYQLGPTSVCAGGEPMPLLFADKGEVRGQLPWDIGPGPVQAIVYRAGTASNAATADVVPHAPGIFPGGVIRARQPCPVDEQNGVRPGVYLEVYGTGQGSPAQPMPSAIPPAAPVATTELPRAFLGEREIPVLYAGFSPLAAGLTQANVKVPADYSPSAAGLYLLQGGVLSNPYPLRVAGEEEAPGFTILGPDPAEVLVQAGASGRRASVRIAGMNSFCELVRFSLTGLPPGVHVSIPVGLPGETVSMEVRAGSAAAPMEDVPVTLIAATVLPGSVERPFRLTVLPSTGDLGFRVTSAGWGSGSPLARFELQGTIFHEVLGGGPGRGFNFVTVDPRTGELGSPRNFDTWASAEAVTALEGFLLSLPEGTVVLGAIADDGALLLTARTRQVLREALGSELIDSLEYQASWAIISRKGAARPMAEDVLAEGRVVLERVLSFPMPAAEGP